MVKTKTPSLAPNTLKFGDSRERILLKCFRCKGNLEGTEDLVNSPTFTNLKLYCDDCVKEVKKQMKRPNKAKGKK